MKQDNIEYEIHITVEDGSDESRLKSLYNKIGVKPLIIENIHKDGKKSVELLTKQNVKEDPFYHMSNTIHQLNYFNSFKVVRSKVETVQWNPLIPEYIQKHQYWECHFDITGK